MKKIKFNRKLWKKFYYNRIYMWDLVEVEDSKELIIHRRFRLNSRGTDKFMYEDKTHGEIPPIPRKPQWDQISSYLNSRKGDDAFILARKICQKNKNYRLRVNYIIKLLIPV